MWFTFFADGTLDTAFSANLAFDGSVNALASAPGGQFYVAGTSWSSGTVERLVRFNADGSRDRGFAYTYPAAPSYLVVQEDGRVIVRVGYDYQRVNLDGTVDTTFRSNGLGSTNYFAPAGAWLRDDGQLLVVDYLRYFATKKVSLPLVLTPATTEVVAPQGSMNLSVDVQSDTPVTYQWMASGAPLPGATNASFTLGDFQPGMAGTYSVAVTNLYGTTTATIATLVAPPYTAGHLINLSVRAVADSDANPLIVGYSVGGTGLGGNKQLMVRAVGPSLTQFGVSGVLADPLLELYDGASKLIDQNDDWTGVFDFHSLGAFPFAGTAPKDSAIYNPFTDYGSESIVVAGKNGGRGVVLAEVYDATAESAFTQFTLRLTNGSARSRVGTGDDVLILGFTIGGQTREKLLVRAVGPRLAEAPFNLNDVLVDPKLEIYRLDQTKVAENDNWDDNGAMPNMLEAFAQVSAFDLKSGAKDAAAIVELDPGIYSAVVRGVGNTTGTAIVELYELR